MTKAKKILAALLTVCMLIGLLPTAALAGLVENTQEKNQAILAELEALHGDKAMAREAYDLLLGYGLVDEDGNVLTQWEITMDGHGVTLAELTQLIEEGADLSRKVSVDGTELTLADLKTMLEIDAEVRRLKETYFPEGGFQLDEERQDRLDSLYRQLGTTGLTVEAEKPDGAEEQDIPIVKWGFVPKRTPCPAHGGITLHDWDSVYAQLDEPAPENIRIEVDAMGASKLSSFTFTIWKGETAKCTSCPYMEGDDVNAGYRDVYYRFRISSGSALLDDGKGGAAPVVWTDQSVSCNGPKDRVDPVTTVTTKGGLHSSYQVNFFDPLMIFGERLHWKRLFDSGAFSYEGASLTVEEVAQADVDAAKSKAEAAAKEAGEDPSTVYCDKVGPSATYNSVYTIWESKTPDEFPAALKGYLTETFQDPSAWNPEQTTWTDKSHGLWAEGGWHVGYGSYPSVQDGEFLSDTLTMTIRDTTEAEITGYAYAKTEFDRGETVPITVNFSEPMLNTEGETPKITINGEQYPWDGGGGKDITFLYPVPKNPANEITVTAVTGLEELSGRKYTSDPNLNQTLGGITFIHRKTDSFTGYSASLRNETVGAPVFDLRIPLNGPEDSRAWITDEAVPETEGGAPATACPPCMRKWKTWVGKFPSTWRRTKRARPPPSWGRPRPRSI